MNMTDAYGVVGNPVVSLGVAMDFGMAGTVLVPMSQFGEDQLLLPGARLCPT